MSHNSRNLSHRISAPTPEINHCVISFFSYSARRVSTTAAPRPTARVRDRPRSPPRNPPSESLFLSLFLFFHFSFPFPFFFLSLSLLCHALAHAQSSSTPPCPLRRPPPHHGCSLPAHAGPCSLPSSRALTPGRLHALHAHHADAPLADPSRPLATSPRRSPSCTARTTSRLDARARTA